MALPTNTYITYATTGIREDLTDIITNISPMETFVTSTTGSKRAMQTYHEWQTDSLAAAAANKAKEGDDASAAAASATSRTGNYTQILDKVWLVSGTEDAVNMAGRGVESDYQTTKNLKELARDIEYALVINTSSDAGCSDTERQLKGLDGWITTNYTDGSTASLTESKLNDNLQLIWAAGGFPKHTLCGAYQKRKISNFTTNTRNVMASEKEITRAIDVLYSDFGTIQIRLHHQIQTTIPATVMTLGDMDLWNKAWLRPVMKTQLALTGDNRKFQALGELTLESLQEKGSGKIDGLTTAD